MHSPSGTVDGSDCDLEGEQVQEWWNFSERYVEAPVNNFYYKTGKKKPPNK